VAVIIITNISVRIPVQHRNDNNIITTIKTTAGDPMIGLAITNLPSTEIRPGWCLRPTSSTLRP
jgi:hypothetical protein